MEGNKLTNTIIVLLCIITLYTAIEVVKFIDRCKKNQQEQIEILHRIDHVLKKIKLPPVNRTFTIDAAVQAGATIIVNEKQ